MCIGSRRAEGHAYPPPTTTAMPPTTRTRGRRDVNVPPRAAHPAAACDGQVDSPKHPPDTSSYAVASRISGRTAKQVEQDTGLVFTVPTGKSTDPVSAATHVRLRLQRQAIETLNDALNPTDNGHDDPPATEAFHCRCVNSRRSPAGRISGGASRLHESVSIGNSPRRFRTTFSSAPWSSRLRAERRLSETSISTQERIFSPDSRNQR
jgi:hypothetical protein